MSRAFYCQKLQNLARHSTFWELRKSQRDFLILLEQTHLSRRKAYDKTVLGPAPKSPKRHYGSLRLF